MKVVFIIAGKSFNFFDFKRVRSENTKLIAIVNSGHEPGLLQETKNNLDEVIIVEDEKKVGPLFMANPDSVLKAAHQSVQKYKPDKIYVVCTDEGNIMVSSQVREHFSTTGMKPEQAILFRDKIKMKRVLSENNIPVPKFMPIDINKLISNDHYYKSVKKNIGTPFIIKPTSAAAGFGVHRIDSVKKIKYLSRSGIENQLEYEAEELLIGNMYHCDMGLYKGRPVFKECALYNTNNFDSESKNNLIGSYSLSDEDPLKKEIIQFCIRALIAMGGFDGFYHCEVFVKNNNITLLEIGARLPGALISQMYHQMYEANLFNIDFLIQTEQVLLPTLSRQYYGLWIIYILYQNAYLKRIKSHKNFSINWNVQEGDLIKINDDGYKFIGHCLYKNKDHSFVEATFEALKKLGLSLLDLKK